MDVYDLYEYDIMWLCCHVNFLILNRWTAQYLFSFLLKLFICCSFLTTWLNPSSFNQVDIGWKLFNNMTLLQFKNSCYAFSSYKYSSVRACRKIVLATNIAESSITIDDVVYVLDCGKAKETSYDALNKLACLLPSWISKASAHQVCC